MTPTGVFRERRKSRARAKEGRYRLLRRIFFSEFIEAIIAAVIVAAILRIFVVAVYRIPSDSMAPTLIPGDFIVAWKSSYGVRLPFSDAVIGARDPKRGDVVVFHLPGDESLFIKRVVGIAGDRIEIRDGKLSVNDVAAEVVPEVAANVVVSSAAGWEIAEEVTGGTTHRVMRRKSTEEPDFHAPQVIPPGQVFLLGDLRSEGTDSRQWGPLPASLILARVSFIAFSTSAAGTPAGTTSTLPTQVIEQSRLARVFKSVE